MVHFYNECGLPLFAFILMHNANPSAMTLKLPLWAATATTGVHQKKGTLNLPVCKVFIEVIFIFLALEREKKTPLQ